MESLTIARHFAKVCFQCGKEDEKNIQKEPREARPGKRIKKW